MFFDREGSWNIPLFQHTIQAYKNIFLKCCVLNERWHNSMFTNFDRATAKAELCIHVHNACARLEIKLSSSGLVDSQKKQLQDLLKDFKNFNV